MQSGKKILEVRNLRKVYRTGEVETPALRGVDLILDEGEFASVVGPSGCGKTTLLNLIGGLDAPNSGTIIFEGVRLDQCSEKELSRIRLAHIGFVFQA